MQRGPGPNMLLVQLPALQIEVCINCFDMFVYVYISRFALLFWIFIAFDGFPLIAEGPWIQYTDIPAASLMNPSVL